MLNFETDSALVAPEYHYDVGASPAPDNLVVSPLVLSAGPSENHVAARPAADNPAVSPCPSKYHECDTAASQSPKAFVLSAGPSENHECENYECDTAASQSPNAFVLSAGPSENHVAARPAPDNPVVSPGRSKYHECDATASQSPNPLVLSASPSENQVAARPAPDTLVVSIGTPDQEPDAAIKPAPASLLPRTGPPESLESNLADAMSNAFSPRQDLSTSAVQSNSSRRPTPRIKLNHTGAISNGFPPQDHQLGFNSMAQNNSSRSSTPRTNRAKRQHSGDTGDKARLVPQDVLTTRVAIQEKDRVIQLLENEVSD